MSQEKLSQTLKDNDATYEFYKTVMDAARLAGAETTTEALSLLLTVAAATGQEGGHTIQELGYVLLSMPNLIVKDHEKELFQF